MQLLVEKNFNINHCKISSHIYPRTSPEHQYKTHSKHLSSILTGHIFQGIYGGGLELDCYMLEAI